MRYLGAAAAERDERRVVLRHLDEQRAVLDGPRENHDLQRIGSIWFITNLVFME